MKRYFDFIYHNYRLRVLVILILASILVSIPLLLSVVPKDVRHTNSYFQDFTPFTPITSRQRSPVAGVNISVQNDSCKSEIKGRTVQFVLNVTNTGNISDTIEISNASTKIWSISLFYVNNWTLLTDTDGDNITDVGDIAPSGAKSIGVNITIPSSVVAGDVNVVTITANSSYNASVTSAVSLTISALDNPADYAFVEIIPNQSQTASPSSTTVYNLTVTNKGNFNDTIDLTNVTPTNWNATLYLYDEYFVPSSNPLSDTDSDSLPDVGNLTPNSTKQIRVEVTIPAVVRYNYSNQVTITAISSLNNSRNSTAILSTYFYTAADIVIIDNATFNKIGGDSIIYNITITNNGPVNDTVEVRNYSVFTGWNISFSYTNGTKLRDNNDDGGVDTGVLSVDDSLVVTANITIPTSAHGNTTNNITITAISSNNDTEKESITLLVNIIPFYGLEVSENQSKNCNVGENVTYTLTIINKGNMDDVFDINVNYYNVSYELYKDNVTLLTNTGGSSAVDTGMMAPNEQMNISIRGFVPKTEVLINNTDYLDFNITSVENSAKYVLRRMQVNMTKPPYIIVSPNSVCKSGDPGTTISQTFTVRNNGFRKENYTIRVAPVLYSVSTNTSVTGSWNMSVTAGGGLNLDGGSGGLYYANDTAIGDYSLQIDVGVPFGTSIDIKDVISITVNSTNESAVAQFVANINPVAIVNASTLNNTSSVGFNTTVNYTITIYNNGSVSDTIDCLYLSPNNWSVNIVNVNNGNPLVDTDSDGIVDVGNLTPGTSVNISVKIKVPRTAVGGTIETTTITPRSSFNITVAPTIDLITNIQTICSVSITPNYTIEMEVNSTRTFDFILTNTGNINDTYDVWVTNLSSGWNFTISGNALPMATNQIALNQTITLSGNLYISRSKLWDTEPTHIIFLRCMSRANSSIYSEISLVINVIKPKTRLIVGVDNETKFGNTGTVVSYKMTLTNNDFYDNCKVELSFPPTIEALFVSNRTIIGASNWDVAYTNDAGVPLERGGYGGMFVDKLNDGQSKIVYARVTVPLEESSDIMIRTNISATLYESEYGTYSTPIVLYTMINPKVSVDVYAGQTTTFGKPNTNITNTIFVVNNGTASDTLNVLFSSNSNWSVRLSSLSGNLITDTNGDDIPDVGNLSYGNSIELNLVIDVPPDADYGANDTITITAFSSWNSSKRDNITITVRASVVAEHIINVSKYSDMDNPGRTVSYNITILNKGNAKDVINIYNTSLLGWDVRLLKDGAVLTDTNGDGIVDTGALARNESKNITVEVAIPSNTGGDAVNIVNLFINSTLLPAYDRNIQLNTITNAIANFYIGPNATLQAYPGKGEKGEFDCIVRVANLGNVPDTIDINYTAPEGWEVTAYKTNSLLLDSNDNDIMDTGIIERNETVNITFKIVVPKTAPQGNVTIDITGTSSKNPSLHKSIALSIEVNTTMTIELYTNKSRLYGSINRSVEFALTVVNRAEFSNVIDIQNSQLEQGWIINYYLDETPLTDTDGNSIIDVGTLGRFESRNLLVRVFVPSGAQLNKDYKITIVGNTTSISGTVNITITPVSYTFSLIPLENVTKNGSPGYTLSYNFMLRNSGAIINTFGISVSSSCKWDVILKDSKDNTIANNITAPAKSDILLTAKIFIREPARFDTTDVTTIKFTSEKNESNYDVITFTSRVNKLIDITIETDKPSGTKWNWTVATKQQMCTFVVKNVGNAPDTVYITNTTLPWSSIKYYIGGRELDYDSNAAGYNIGNIDPDPSNSKMVNVWLEEPPLKSSARDSYTVIFTVFPSSEPSKKVSSTLKIDATYAAITLKATSSTTITISPDDSVKVTLILTNDGNTVDNIKISVTSMNGWTIKMLSSTYRLQSGDSASFTVELTPPPQLAIPSGSVVVDNASVRATSEVDKSISDVVYIDSAIRPNIIIEKPPLISISEIFADKPVTIKIPIKATNGVDLSKLRVTIRIGDNSVRTDELLSIPEVGNKSIIFTYTFKSPGFYNTTFSINSGSAESNATDNQISLMIEVKEIKISGPDLLPSLLLPIFAAAAITLVVGTVLIVRGQRIKKRKEKDKRGVEARVIEEERLKKFKEAIKTKPLEEKVKIVKKKKTAAERKKILEEPLRMTDLISKEKGAFTTDDDTSLSMDFSMKGKSKEVDERRKAINLGEFVAAPKKEETKAEGALKLVADFEIEPKKPVKKIKEEKEEKETEGEIEKKRKKKPPKAVIVEDGHEIEWG